MFHGRQMKIANSLPSMFQVHEVELIERQVFENGGYQIRVSDNKVILDVCKDGKCFSMEKPIIEFYSYKLKKECERITAKINKMIKEMG